jgi:VTC domain
MKVDRAQRQRREIKYIVSEKTARQVRSFLTSYLDPDENAVGKVDNSYEVQSLYLDSNQLTTYHAAANGERNRFKLRIRYYDEDPASPVYFEIKRRINEGIVKQRARVGRHAIRSLLVGASPSRGDLHAWNPQQWSDLLDFWQLVERLQAAPRLHNAYMREAYVSGGKGSVRVTLDRNVHCEPEFGGDLSAKFKKPSSIFSGVVILELKFTERMPTWMIEMVRGFDLTSSGAAKYGDGVEKLGHNKVARRLTGFQWGNSETTVATSAPWLDASTALRSSLGPNRK